MRRWVWFVVIYIAGVAIIGAIAWLIRSVLV